MTELNISPTVRTSFDSALVAVLSEHSTLRQLATVITTTRSGFSTDHVLSLADALFAHESIEAHLFALPLITHPPVTVTSTSMRASQLGHEYTSGNYRLPDPRAAAARFVDALLIHLAVEEAWLSREQKYQAQRVLTSIN
jgi:hypothetical protein